MQDRVKKQLFKLIDPDYQQFSASLNPGITNIVGVRLPKLRQIAREIAKNDWRTYLETAQSDYFEEIMLQGMVIGLLKQEIEEVLSHVALFIPKIDNWSVCDSFCAGLKLTKQHRERVWIFIQPYFDSEQPFELRFAVVMLLSYYLDATYIDRVFSRLEQINHDNYYVKMAVAWAIATSYVKMPDQTMRFLQNNTLDDFTYHKALQKITESRRVDQQTKQRIRKLKRK